MKRRGGISRPVLWRLSLMTLVALIFLFFLSDIPPSFRSVSLRTVALLLFCVACLGGRGDLDRLSEIDREKERFSLFRIPERLHRLRRGKGSTPDFESFSSVFEPLRRKERAPSREEREPLQERERRRDS
ncbi:hypothetical protein [Aminirod propionatiphilus]|uniref:Uncharacterized protein n=1 Tax=Aminirod propionatiphilus TaxID=3415223 RepID=A0ACD1DVV3_9BACT|nr:hypothetical protein KIH16_13910 [Synergistota bacterium]